MEQTKAALKAFFETGDKPTEAQFADFIDSYSNIADLGNPVIAKHFGIVTGTTVGTNTTIISDTFVVPANTLSVDGDSLEITAYGDMTAETTQKNIRITFGASVAQTNFVVLPAIIKKWHLEARLVRISAGNQQLFVKITVAIVDTVLGNGIVLMDENLIVAEDLTTPINLDISGRAVIAGSITFRNWTIRKFSV